MNQTLSIDEGKIDGREDGGQRRFDVVLLCLLTATSTG